MAEFETESILTCPHCGFKESLQMPTDSCQWFHECKQCQQLLKPLQGDCCVFCSYGSVACPPIQLQQAGKGGGDCCNA